MQVFYLNQAQQPMLRKHIDGLPALYLDCDTDIDLDRDMDARSAFACQIRDFSEHVRALREARWLPRPNLCSESGEAHRLRMHAAACAILCTHVLAQCKGRWVPEPTLVRLQMACLWRAREAVTLLTDTTEACQMVRRVRKF